MIQYTKEYQTSNTKFLAIHNTGGLAGNPFASTEYLSASGVNLAHKNRFDMLSSLGWYIGYNFFIDIFGTITQPRAIGEETAANIGHNFNGEAISVCLAGNFTTGVDSPTKAQIGALKSLYAELNLSPFIPIVPHRAIQAGTACYGDLPDTWARDLLLNTPQVISKLQQILTDLINQINLLKKKLGFSILGYKIADPCYLQDNRG